MTSFFNVSLNELYNQKQALELEIQTREQALGGLADIKLQSLSLSAQARYLLYKQLEETSGITNNRIIEELNLKDLYTYLIKDNWQQIQFLNPKAYQEIEAELKRQEASLQNFYGIIKPRRGKAAAKSVAGALSKKKLLITLLIL